MKYLCFDVETNTFPRKDLSPSHPHQAQVIQLAAIQCDENFNEIHSLYSLLKMRGNRTMNEGAFKAHGISSTKCNEEGRVAEDVMGEFSAMIETSDIQIGHNIQFDRTMIDIEYGAINNGFVFQKEFEEYCTMELMTSICKLPFTKKRTFGQKYKWPKLQEAYQHCFKESFEGAHDALADVRATIKIFRWLVENKYITISEPSNIVSL